MMQLHLSNDQTEIDMQMLATAFGLSRESLDNALSLGAISYWYEIEPGDTAKPRAVFSSKETGQRLTLDRIGRIMLPETKASADQPVPCSETCQPDSAEASAADPATPVGVTPW